MVTVGVDSYGDEAGLLAYATARGITITRDKTELLILAMDWFYTLNFAGLRYSPDQNLDLPRNFVAEGDTEGVVPTKCISAQYEAALLIDAGKTLVPDGAPKVLRKRVEGAIDIHYAESSSGAPWYPKLYQLVSPYATGGGALSFKVYRG